MAIDFDIYRILAQNRPSDTSSHTAYTKPTNQLATIVGVAVCNTTSSPVQFSIYICKNGATYDQTTALAYGMTVASNDTDLVEFPFTLDTTGGTVGVQSNSANALNFTIIGKIKEFI